MIGIKDFEELPLGLSGHARAEALAEFDRGFSGKALIIADVSNDETYGEVLVERFGRRVIGLHITRHGDGMSYEWRKVKNGELLVYTIGRTYLFDLLLREMQNDKVRILDGANSQRAYEQLMNLEKEIGQSGIIYRCLARHHDDLAISCAMVVWAAQHPHLPRWCWPLEPRVARRSSSRAKFSSLDLTLVWFPVRASPMIRPAPRRSIQNLLPSGRAISYGRALLLLPTCPTARGSIRARSKKLA